MFFCCCVPSARRGAADAYASEARRESGAGGYESLLDAEARLSDDALRKVAKKACKAAAKARGGRTDAELRDEVVGAGASQRAKRIRSEEARRAFPK